MDSQTKAPVGDLVIRPEKNSLSGAPEQPIKKDRDHNPAQLNDPGNLILQWVTYALWAAVVLALSLITRAVIEYFVQDKSMGGYAIYPVASVIVLFPVVFVCNRNYRHKEVAKKTGPSSVVMIIHGVLFALISIGSLVAAVFTLTSVLLYSHEASQKMAVIASSLLAALLFFLLFLRATNPSRWRGVVKNFEWIILVISLVCIVPAIIGPMRAERSSRFDRVIRKNIYEIRTLVDQYIETNSKIPENLDQIAASGDIKMIISNDMVTIKPVEKEIKTDSSRLVYSRKYEYQLCANFKKPYAAASAERLPSLTGGKVTEGLATLYNHEAGENCYALSHTVAIR